MALTVRRAEPDDWKTYRTIRLDALASDPKAFGSTWEREVEFTEQQWRDRLTSTVFLVELDGEAVGTIGGFLDEQQPDVLHVVGTWVRPQVRGQGAADALLAALCDAAEVDGVRRMQLWVTESNMSARRFYARWGFVTTGERAELVSDPTLPVLEMVRDLR